jgi:hypothetical protein
MAAVNKSNKGKQPAKPKQTPEEVLGLEGLIKIEDNMSNKPCIVCGDVHPEKPAGGKAQA